MKRIVSILPLTFACLALVICAGIATAEETVKVEPGERVIVEGLYPDTDGDEVRDNLDNCMLTANPGQTDTDEDGQGDICDSTDDRPDTDSDGLKDYQDNCPAVPNAGQEDKDGDHTGDACDGADDRPDTDLDGFVDVEDNCGFVSNPAQDDLDTDGTGDVCDSDIDGDGHGNAPGDYDERDRDVWDAPDTTPPAQPEWTQSPAGGSTTGQNVTLAFTNGEQGVTNRCSLDGAAYEVCSSPKNLSGLAGGAHTFSVVAVDEAGNQSVPRIRGWSVAVPVSGCTGVNIQKTQDLDQIVNANSATNPTTFCLIDAGVYDVSQQLELRDGDKIKGVVGTRQQRGPALYANP